MRRGRRHERGSPGASPPANRSTAARWAALLEPQGPRHVGHWVVVDGVDRELLILVRDPVGEAYGIPMLEFLGLWHFAVVVLEKEDLG